MAARLLELLLSFYMLLIFVWVLGSWFPQWKGQSWYRMIGEAVEPYINLFKPLRLQMGLVDFTPMVAMFALAFLRALVAGLAGGRGL